MNLKKMMWDEQNQSVRGSFINASITFSYLILIILGSVISAISKNLREMESFLIGFFVVSFGFWSGKKLIETTKGLTVDSKIAEYLKKVGVEIKPGNDQTKGGDLK